jgi:hypothetical protein
VDGVYAANFLTWNALVMLRIPRIRAQIPGENQQNLGLFEQELTAEPEAHHDHHDSSDETEPP